MWHEHNHCMTLTRVSAQLLEPISTVRNGGRVERGIYSASAESFKNSIKLSCGSGMLHSSIADKYPILILQSPV
jgi:hypothetical protein